MHDIDCQRCAYEHRITFMYGLIVGTGLTGAMVVLSMFAQKWILGS